MLFILNIQENMFHPQNLLNSEIVQNWQVMHSKNG
jgi:hypothetical protein